MRPRAGTSSGGKIAVIALVVVGVVLVARWAAQGGLPRPPAEAEPTGQKMTYDWTVLAADGQEVRVSRFSGRALFLNFWATWCPPCVAEMPAIDSLYQKMQDEEIGFLLVSTESIEPVRDFAEERNLTVPVYAVKGDVPASLAPSAIPTTYVVSPEGDIVLRRVGAAQWDDEAFVAMLRKLAGGAAAEQASRSDGTR